jgi:hypothetical protein
MHFEVRNASPPSVVVDGSLEEWGPLTDTGGLPRVIVAVEPTRWWLVWEEDVLPTRTPAFELSLPYSGLPTMGEASSGGEIDCDYTPFPTRAKRRAKDRSVCNAMRRRYLAQVAADERRFRALFELRAEKLTVTRAGKTEDTAPLRAACSVDAHRQRCEFELQLTWLPRTSEIDVSQIGFAVPVAGPAPRAETWIALPEAVAFESGIGLHRLVIGGLTNSPVHPRYSYQPGNGDEYEIASRDRSLDFEAMSDVSISRCRPGPVLGRLGMVTLRDNCAADGNIYLFVDGELTGMVTAGKVLVRDGTLLSINKLEYFDYLHFYPAASWTVERIGPDGIKQAPLQFNTEGSLCETSHAWANADYSVLALTCDGMGEDGGRRRRRMSWYWDREQKSYLPR